MGHLFKRTEFIRTKNTIISRTNPATKSCFRVMNRIVTRIWGWASHHYRTPVYLLVQITLLEMLRKYQTIKRILKTHDKMWFLPNHLWENLRNKGENVTVSCCVTFSVTIKDSSLEIKPSTFVAHSGRGPGFFWALGGGGFGPGPKATEGYPPEGGEGPPGGGRGGQGTPKMEV